MGPVMYQLIDDSRQLLWLEDSRALEVKVQDREVPLFKEYIAKHPDYSSFHLLFALYRDFPDTYREIPVNARASILCSELRNVRYVNEWGLLSGDYEYVQNSKPAKALLDLGKSGIPFLVPLLDDPSKAPLEGSEEAEFSDFCEFRRADYACEFLSFILNIPYVFSESASERDKGIVRIKKTALEQNVGQ